MDRREALRVLGAAAVAPLVVPLSPAERWDLGVSLHRRLATFQDPRALTTAQMAEVRALGETILPRTDTPGATDVGAPEFFDLLLADWYSDEDRRQLVAGLDALSERCRAQHGRPLAELDAPTRAQFVATLDGRRGEPSTPEGAYTRIKSQLVFAFLTSEPIASIVNQTPIIPGRFDGCVPV
jgi:hypothetical protein